MNKKSNGETYCQLKINNDQGFIFLSSVTSISGTINIESKKELTSYEILISDKNLNEIYRKSLSSNEFNSPREILFVWNLKSNSNSYVKSGCYTIRLIDKSNELNKVECCLVECKVADTRNILIITRSLKRSHTLIPKTSEPILSIYLDILEGIQTKIIERLKNNKFEEPYFVACVTELFIQGLAEELHSQTKSDIRDLITEFQLKNHISEQEMRSSKLNLSILYDFVINQMSELEDYVRAKAMVESGQRNLTQNDKNQIVSSLVLTIYEHAKIIKFPKNIIGNISGKIVEDIIKLGIKYISTKHINKSISICQTL